MAGLRCPSAKAGRQSDTAHPGAEDWGCWLVGMRMTVLSAQSNMQDNYSTMGAIISSFRPAIVILSRLFAKARRFSLPPTELAATATEWASVN